MQTGLNFSIYDPVGAPSTIPIATLPNVESSKQYRLFHHYQTRFTLTSSGKIDTASLYDIHDDAELGPTKINGQINAGAFSFTVMGVSISSPQIGPFVIDSIENPKNGSSQTSSDGTQHSFYASGRIGYEGQNANWRIFGKDVPWIFSEIICQVAPDHTVTSNIKTSVDQIWQPTGPVAGEHNFNNINIYKAEVSSVDGSVNYDPQSGSPILMEGQVRPFIDSIPIGTWPSPPPSPSVR